MAQDFTLRQESRLAQKEFRLGNEIFDIFQDYLKSTTSLTTADVAQAVDKLAPASGKQEIDDFIWNTWNNLFQIAQQIPYNSLAQYKLVGVFRELSLLPDGGKAGWQKLPQLGWVLRDWFNLMPNEKTIASDHADDIIGFWVNVNAFWARLGGNGVHSTIDLAIWSLRSALEDEISTDNGRLVNSRVLAAAQYIEYEGHILQQRLALNWKPQDNEVQMFRGGPLFTGDSGLSDARWEFWISQFRELSEKTSTEEAKSAAIRAARLLEIARIDK